MASTTGTIVWPRILSTVNEGDAAILRGVVEKRERLNVGPTKEACDLDEKRNEEAQKSRGPRFEMIRVIAALAC